MESTCSDYKNHGYDINDTEKENLLKVLTSEPERGNSVNENYIGLVVDHFRVLNRIREYDPNIRMRANNKTKFHTEHMELSKIITQIKKGWVIQYFYPEETIRQIQQPIKVFKSIDIGPDLKGTDMDDYITIIPLVLTREEEYIEEGKFMHHCVASYAETDTSIIVSLRNDENERATIEYQLRKINDEVIIQRVQSLGKRNTKLSSDWDGVLFSLDKIMLSYIQNKNFKLVKVIKENKMGMRFESNSVWNSWGSLDWEDKRINQGFIGLFY